MHYCYLTRRQKWHFGVRIKDWLPEWNKNLKEQRRVKMVIDRSHLRDEEKKFLEHIVQNHGVPSRSNGEAYALFNAIQHAFMPMADLKNSEVVHIDLVAYLAACSWVVLNYNKDENIPWDKGNHDYIILHALRAFIVTLVNAIKNKKTWRDWKALPVCLTPLYHLFRLRLL